ncbi:MAG: ATP-binding protein [Methylobacillus sp.]|nr:ATP-binding protein [Methylobacillus sp.]
MNPINNPFAPGAGAPPPELAGRATIREQVRVATERARLGRPAKSVMLIGLRGTGKTVLLDQMRRDAEQAGMRVIRIEAPEKRSLPAVLAPELRLALLNLSRTEAAKSFAVRGLRALAGFVKTLKVTYSDIEVGLDFEAEPGLADNGDLEVDLTTLLAQAGLAAQAAGTALILFMDELQYVPEAQLAALVTALHRCAQDTLPVMLVGAGLPQLRGRMGKAKSYAERLFDFPEIGPLATPDARRAIEAPCLQENVLIEAAAVKRILDQTQGYPYFLQEWGKQAWDVASNNRITLADVEAASKLAVAALDESFFRIRFERLTLIEKDYLYAMAQLGPGPHRSGAIADHLKRGVQSLAPTRASLINKGMVWSPTHGETAFTVPLFDEFMKRIMAGDATN